MESMRYDISGESTCDEENCIPLLRIYDTVHTETHTSAHSPGPVWSIDSVMGYLAPPQKKRCAVPDQCIYWLCINWSNLSSKVCSLDRDVIFENTNNVNGHRNPKLQ